MNEDLFIFCLVRVVAIISLESHSYISNSDRLTAQKIKAKKFPETIPSLLNAMF